MLGPLHKPHRSLLTLYHPGASSYSPWLTDPSYKYPQTRCYCPHLTDEELVARGQVLVTAPCAFCALLGQECSRSCSEAGSGVLESPVSQSQEPSHHLTPIWL